MSTLVVTSPEVADALSAKRPVVALESTIIAHGMSYPANVATALEVEALIRDEGAIPATIAVIGGKLHAGLGADQIEHIGKAGAGMPKLSTRDLAYAMATASDGATTVASTMQIAARAGIRIFATGGIGGVHRGAGDTFDISADLTELSRTPVAVVSAGAKAILDLPLTLEWLETLSVPVVGYGTDEFPAFYSRASALPLHIRCDTPKEVAALLAAQWQLGSAGVLVANPIPVEHEIQAAEIAPVIADAVLEAQRRQIVGKAVTPFLLARLAEVTAGRSLASNIALVKNNARVAAHIAAAYCART
ncbi:MAG: pseudouridine-5'-phosphate glycosidase [Hyphomicrobiales bacterium]